MKGSKVRIPEYIGYSCGEMGYTIQNTIIASYMVMYFTNAVGINALVIGTMTLVCRIIDAFTDVGFGMLVDRTHGRLGKFKPWYMGSVIPCCLAFFLLFAVPGGIGSGSAMAVLWMYIMYILWGSIFATINYTWLNAHPAVATANPAERRNFSTWRQWGASLIGVVVSYVGVDLIIKFNMGELMAAGGKGSPMGFRKGYLMMGLIVGLISLVLMIYSAIVCKERVKEATEGTKVSFREGFKVVKGNKLLWGALLVNVFMFMFATFTTGLTSYFYDSYVANPMVIPTVMGIGGIVGLIINTLITPILNKKFRKEVLHVIAMVCLILAMVIIFLAPKGNIVVYIVGWSLFQGVIHLANVIFFRTVPDAIDWGEWKHGVYAPGVVSAVVSFMQKVGMGVASFILTAVLAACGLQEGAMVQSEAFGANIRVAYLVVPVVVVLLTLIGFFLVRSVPKSEIIQMRKDLAAKRGVEFDEKNALV